MTSKQKRIALWVVKIVIFAASLLYVILKVARSSRTSGLSDGLSKLDSGSMVQILIVILMVFINWGLEAFKWKMLISKLEPISLIRSWKAIWAGLTVNYMIPNRVAEFLVRILFLKRENRIKAIFSTLIGGYYQFFVTFLVGSVALVWWFRYMPVFHLSILIISLLGLNYLAIFGIFRMHIFTGTMSRIKIIKRLEEYYSVLDIYKRKEVFRMLAISLVRYFVYVIQYYLLFRAFGVEMTLWQGIMIASLIFLTQALVPSITLTELGIRGAVVLYFAGAFSHNVAGMLCAAYVLWIVNIILPSFFGSVFILSVRKK
jgi:uncharacterized membrane protein YbhN (UPF0104 family)